MCHCLKEEQRFFELVVEYICLELLKSFQCLTDEHLSIKVADHADVRAHGSNTILTVNQCENTLLIRSQFCFVTVSLDSRHSIKVLDKEAAQTITSSERQRDEVDMF